MAGSSARSRSESSDIGLESIPNLRRLTCVTTVTKYTLFEEEKKRNKVQKCFFWYTGWAIPGLGMFSEAYMMFSIGMIKPFQKVIYPNCFEGSEECLQDLVKVQNYIQLVGIILGMLLFGALGDVIGRRWGSRLVASIMLTGAFILVFTPLVPNPLAYLQLYIAAQTWYGLGIGGEYPMAAASAAERSQAAPGLRKKRGQQVLLTFSQQGMGNLVNGCVILVCMVIFGQAGQQLDASGSRKVVIVQFAVGAAITVFMTMWRYTRLTESQVWAVEREDAVTISREVEKKSRLHLYHVTLRFFWPRLFATCGGWIASNFPFYGMKFFQSTFIALLYPQATEFQRMQWSTLNNAIALVGYWCAAYVVDQRHWGRRRLQGLGFVMMSVLFLICGLAFPSLIGSTAGLHGFQFLFFFSSFWNQFGPNCTTWLVAAEVFPTGVRTTFQGISAAAGKVGAIMANLLFSYVEQRTTFYLSAAFALLGFIITWLFLPDTTGMHLDELDRMHKYALADAFEHYHGEAVHKGHLSPFERVVFGWGKRHDPRVDTLHRAMQGFPVPRSLTAGSERGSPRVA